MRLPAPGQPADGEFTFDFLWIHRLVGRGLLGRVFNLRNETRALGTVPAGHFSVQHSSFTLRKWNKKMKMLGEVSPGDSFLSYLVSL